MITKLTKDQEARFPEFIKKWTDIGLSTEPADRTEAEEAIIEMYQIAGLPAPKIVWCSSPLSNALTKLCIENIFASAKIGASVGASVGDSVGDSVAASVRASVGASVRASVGASVWASVGDSVRDSVGDSVWDSVRASVWASVGDSVAASVGASVWASVRASMYGQHDANWLGFYDYFADVCGLTEQTEKLSGLWRLCKSAGWAMPHRNICFVSERHNILKRDEQGRLHCTDGIACGYPDGWGVYAVHGVRVPADIIENPASITVDRIEKESNAEVRRVMIDRYGQDRYLLDSNAKVVHQDDFGVLYRKELKGDEPIVMVKVVNSTPEPDGSYKDYFLRVDPSCKTAKGAIAWTFGMTEKEYCPAQES